MRPIASSRAMDENNKSKKNGIIISSNNNNSNSGMENMSSISSDTNPHTTPRPPPHSITTTTTTTTIQTPPPPPQQHQQYQDRQNNQPSTLPASFPHRHDYHHNHNHNRNHHNHNSNNPFNSTRTSAYVSNNPNNPFVKRMMLGRSNTLGGTSSSDVASMNNNINNTNNNSNDNNSSSSIGANAPSLAFTSSSPYSSSFSFSGEMFNSIGGGGGGGGQSTTAIPIPVPVPVRQNSALSSASAASSGSQRMIFPFENDNGEKTLLSKGVFDVPFSTTEPEPTMETAGVARSRRGRVPAGFGELRTYDGVALVIPDSRRNRRDANVIDLERETGSDNNGVYGVNTQLRNNGDFNTFAVSRFEGPRVDYILDRYPALRGPPYTELSFDYLNPTTKAYPDNGRHGGTTPQNVSTNPFRRPPQSAPPPSVPRAFTPPSTIRANTAPASGFFSLSALGMEPRTTSNNNPKRMSTMTGIWEDARKLDNEESSVSQSRPPDIETRRRGFSRRTTIDEALGVDITGLLRDTNTRNDNVVPRSSNVGDPEPNSQSSFVKASQMDRGEIHSRLSRNVDGSSYRRRHIEDHFNLQHPGPERHSILSSSFGVGEEAGDRGLRGVRNNYSDDPWAIRPLPPTAGRGGHHNQVPSSANGTFSLLKESKGKPVEFSSYDDDCDDRSEQGLRTLRPPEQDELRRIPPPPPTPTPRRYRRRGGKAERRKPASDTVEAGAGKQGASVYQHRYSGVDASTVQPFRRNDADNGGYPFPSSSSSSGGIFRPFDVQTRCSADSNVFSDFAPVSDRASCSSWSLPSVVEPNPSLKRKLINGAKSLMRLGMKRGAGEGSSGRKKPLAFSSLSGLAWLRK